MAIENQEEANEVISEKLEEAYKLISDCEKIADEFQCHFKFELVYGAGASYTPKPKKEDWKESINEDDFGWQASSQGC